MKVALVIERRALLLWSQIMTREEGAKRSHPKWENLWKNTLKEEDLRVAVNLRRIEALIKKEVPHRKGDQKVKEATSICKQEGKKKKHQRYSSSPSTSSSSNDDSDESKHWNNEGKESTDSIFRVVSEEDEYKYSLPPDMAQYANVNFDTYIKKADLINAVLIKNPVPENINHVKTLDDLMK